MGLCVTRAPKTWLSNCCEVPAATRICDPAVTRLDWVGLGRPVASTVTFGAAEAPLGLLAAAAEKINQKLVGALNKQFDNLYFQITGL